MNIEIKGSGKDCIMLIQCSDLELTSIGELLTLGIRLAVYGDIALNEETISNANQINTAIEEHLYMQ